jgi:hypothetical protein
MVSIQLELPEDLKSTAQRRAAEGGHKSVEDYIESLLLADAAQREDAQGEREEQLEAPLLERLNDPRPSIEATPEF